MAGSSAGALVSSVVASGRTPTEAAGRLEELLVSDYWKKDSFFKILYKLLLKRGRGYTGFVSTDRLIKTLFSLLKVKTFEQCPIPLYIVATNITKGMWKKAVERKMKRSSGINAGTLFQFGVRDAKEVETYGKFIKVVEEWSYFEDKDIKPRLLKLFRNFKFMTKTQWTIKATIG